MRLCRYCTDPETPQVGFYFDDAVIPITAAASVVGLALPQVDWLIPFLTHGELRDDILELQAEIEGWSKVKQKLLRISLDEVELLGPLDGPGKILLLAGNYPEHVKERGDLATEREQTFPYVFMKPPTTLQDPDQPVVIPATSPDHIDWEIELGVVIGRTCRGVSEADALDYVAGYTVVNDISDRQFRPNPGRTTRDRDRFFDWQHGKWHDTFCPVGPCLLPADECPDPQNLQLELRLNGEVRQSSSTSQMVFPVAAVISFLSRLMTLEPGDLISTGTPAGVGAASGRFLRSGDVLEAEISGIGTLVSPVISEAGTGA